MLEPDRALYFPNFSHFLTLLDCQSNFSLSLSLLLELDMESATVIHLWCVRMCVCARSQSTTYCLHVADTTHITARYCTFQRRSRYHTLSTYTRQTLCRFPRSISWTLHMSHTKHTPNTKTLHSQYSCGAEGGGGGGGGPELGGGLGPPNDGILRSLCDFPTFPVVAL